jgi:hypothetical protein
MCAGFSFNVTLRGFAGLFAVAFFFEGMLETTTALAGEEVGSLSGRRERDQMAREMKRRA